jgi:hypothetical protein
MNIPNIKNNRMIDIRNVAVSRGVTKRQLGKTTLQHITLLCGKYLPKDDDIRVGVTFNCRNGDLRMNLKALEYMHRDGEAPLYCWQILKDMPIVTLRMANNEVEVGQIVYIVSSSIEDIDPIAIGRIEKLEGSCREMNLDLSKGSDKRCFIRVLEVLRPDGIIHIPRDTRGKQCSCRRFQHGPILDRCDFFQFHHFPDPPFHIIETASRLRLHENQDYLEESRIELCDIDVETNNDTLVPEDENDVLNQTGEEIPYQQEVSTNEESEKCALNDEIEDDDGDDLIFDLNEEQLQTIDDDLEQHDTFSLDNDEDVLNDGEFQALLDAEVESDKDDVEELNSNIRNSVSVTAQRILSSDPIETLIEAINSYEYHAECQQRHPINQSDEDDDIHPHTNMRLLTRVLKDPFHAMDMIKVPMHHDYKPAYFRALRAAIFILNPDDVFELKCAHGLTDTNWEKMLAYRFKYIAQRVRRRIPAPDMLYKRVKVVFDFFQDQLDSKTQKPLFNELARQKAASVLTTIKSGYLSDPPGYSFYVRRFRTNGKPMTDKKGLQLYRSIRGTSNLESHHQSLTKSFGHTFAGAWYNDNVLTQVRHEINWDASIRNDLNFPKIHHYDGLLIDKVNELYVLCFRKPKYPNWISTNDCLCTTSPFGITQIKLDDSESNEMPIIPNGNFTSQSYIAHRQKSSIPFLPVKGSVENKLFRDLVSDAVANFESMSSGNTFSNMVTKWNQLAKGEQNGIYKKQEVYLVRKWKAYRKARSKQDAIQNPDAIKVLHAVHHLPKRSTDGSRRNDEFQDSSMQRGQQEMNVVDTVTPVDDLNSVVNRIDNPRGKRKICTTPGCFRKFGHNCSSKYTKRCKLLMEQGAPLIKITRRKHSRICAVCHQKGCPGQKKRSRCTNLTHH